MLRKVDSVLINGTQLLLNRIYDRIGFNHIGDDILRHLVIARIISQPASKLATVAYLKSCTHHKTIPREYICAREKGE
jgi:hypothetical protein